MVDTVSIKARWDKDAAVWIAISDDVPGLVVEAETWAAMLEEARLVVPDLLELNVDPSSPP